MLIESIYILFIFDIQARPWPDELMIAIVDDMPFYHLLSSVLPPMSTRLRGKVMDVYKIHRALLLSFRCSSFDDPLTLIAHDLSSMHIHQ